MIKLVVRAGSGDPESSLRPRLLGAGLSSFVFIHNFAFNH